MAAPLRSIVGITAALAVGAFGLGTTAPSSAAIRPSTGCAQLTAATGHLAGSAAVRALGPNLAAAAALNRTSPEALTRTLLNDRYARIDQCGSVYYVDPPLTGAAPAVTPAATLMRQAGGLDPTGDAFTLQSRPGSSRTIYLDFLGYSLAGTAWLTPSYGFNVPAPYQAPAFSLDTDATTFSVAEQDAIRTIWLSVAEDYAPFDVNVTTQDPGLAAIDRSGTGDLVYGTRVVFSDVPGLKDNCSCGGVAFLGVFGRTWSHEAYQPALVIPNNLSRSTKAMAEAAAHEVGHNFGLSHDGRSGPAPLEYYLGQGAWDAIMGCSYGRPITQWSKGQYALANNTEDDTSIIAASAPIVADERGADATSAIALSGGVGLDGIVSSPTDQDWYSITTTGQGLSVTVATQSVLADLDVRLQVYGPDGGLVATADPPTPLVDTWASTTSGLSASWSSTYLPAGRYALRITGTGIGDPAGTGYSSYGSTGRYTITATESALTSLSIATTAIAPAVRGVPFTSRLLATGAAGATTWHVTSGTLPVGLVLDTSTGAVSGTAVARAAGDVAVTVGDAAGRQATRSFHWVVNDPVVLVTTAWPAATLGRRYAATGTVSGGDGTYGWWVTAASSMRGLSMSRTGVLSGTPTSVGTVSFSVLVNDDARPSAVAGRSVKRSFTVAIAKPVAISTMRLGAAARGKRYAARLVAMGGNGTYRWARSSGSLPRGLSLSSTGRITGKAARKGTYRVVLLVRDSAGRRATHAFTFVVR